VLSVQDDGRGLDHDAIAAKARRLGLIGPDDQPSDDRLGALIFQPGFSTREAANSIAGRGVGMDVVSQEVGRLHGSITLASQRGQGLRLSIALPARLALEQAMVLRIDGQAFALPVELIERAQSLQPGDVDTTGPHPRVRMCDEMVPLVTAREALGFPPAAPASCPKLLLIRVDGQPLAVLVDAIEGTRERVVKPLGPLLAGHPLILGTSLSVTGEVVFSLNPCGLARWLREGAADAGQVIVPHAAPILVVDDSISVRTVVARRLRLLGYEVEEVSDGLEALGKVRNNTFGLVVTDLEMPRMDGFELLAELSRLAIVPAVPVLVVSTRCDPETRRRVQSLGARELLAKPIDADVLTQRVKALLQVPAGDGPAARVAPSYVPCRVGA
jgi:CheY-like chemotaxis protein